ncbi:MAG: aminoglycoside phosphotransferase family protein [Deltaproteobacteria bacterium]|nr:aminoglycoside phosphotransferase family protein [Deltaproteobacteria bacterium]
MNLHAILAAVTKAAGLGASRASWLLLDRSAPGEAGQVLIVFLEGQPRLTVKLSSDPARADALDREHANLLHLSRLPELCGSVPAAIFAGRAGGAGICVQGFVPGIPLSRLGKRACDRAFEQALAWLGRFQRLASPLDRPPARALARVAAEDYRRLFRSSRRLSALLAESVEGLDPGTRPVACHGDFCAANLLWERASDSLGVIDWEYPLEPRLPVFDLLTLLASLRTRPADRGARHLCAFFSRPAGSAIRAVEVFMRAAGTPPEQAIYQSALSWAQLACRKKRELDAMAASSGVRLPDAAHLPLVLIEADRCLNLEWLAERRGEHLLSRLPAHVRRKKDR